MAKECGEFRPVVKEVKVRLAWPEERRRWDALMEEHHYLGFKQFAGRGLRYVAEWDGRWVALVGWQGGAFKCGPRDRWLGWHKGVQFRRLHLIGNNTRFLILPEGQGVKNLGSHVLGRNLRRLSEDWEQTWGHRLELAETFVDPKRYQGTVYLASNWKRVGRTRGYGRSNGSWTERHGERKEMLLYPLREDARERLRDPEDRREWSCRGVAVDYGKGELQSLRRQLEGVEDFRRAQGRKHRMAAVVSICVLARLAGKVGPTETARFAKSLTQEELRVLGTWFDPKANGWVPPSLATIHRVLAHTGPDSLARQVQRWTAPRCREGTAFAGDGKRICGANRHAKGKRRWETVTLVEHGSGLPVASHSFGEEGGEVAAVRALLEEVDLRGRTVTLDALHTCRDTERALVEQHGAHYLLTVKNNCPETCRMLETVDWESRSRPQATQGPEKGHGRIETRRIDTFCPPPGLLPFSHAKQAFRVTRKRYLIKEGVETVSFAYGITSAGPQQADAAQLLEWNRGHWSIENRNHYRRDTVYGEDQSRIHTHHGPGQQRHHLQRRAGDRPPRRIRQRAGIDRPLSAAPGGRAGDDPRRLSPARGTEPGRQARCPRSTGPASPGPGSRHLQTTPISLSSPRNSTSLTHSWPKMVS